MMTMMTMMMTSSNPKKKEVAPITGSISFLILLALKRRNLYEKHYDLR
jgi:hypothetical protein